VVQGAVVEEECEVGEEVDQDRVVRLVRVQLPSLPGRFFCRARVWEVAEDVEEEEKDGG
jgi:hypothetical protein